MMNESQILALMTQAGFVCIDAYNDIARYARPCDAQGEPTSCDFFEINAGESSWEHISGDPDESDDDAHVIASGCLSNDKSLHAYLMTNPAPVRMMPVNTYPEQHDANVPEIGDLLNALHPALRDCIQSFDILTLPVNSYVGRDVAHIIIAGNALIHACPDQHEYAHQIAQVVARQARVFFFA